MPRRNRPSKSRRPQGARHYVQSQTNSKQYQTLDGSVIDASKMAKLVKPDAVCHGNPLKPKFAFFTEGKAAQALANARKNHVKLRERLEERYYQCEHGSDQLVAHGTRVDLSHIVEHFHLTSRPEWVENKGSE